MLTGDHVTAQDTAFVLDPEVSSCFDHATYEVVVSSID